jgi:hypothetical protein
LRRRFGRLLHRFPAQVLDVGIARGVAALHANPEPHRNAARSALQDPLVEDEPAAGAVLEEKVCVVAASSKRDGQESFANRGINARRASRGEGGSVARARRHGHCAKVKRWARRVNYGRSL